MKPRHRFLCNSIAILSALVLCATSLPAMADAPSTSPTPPTAAADSIGDWGQKTDGLTARLIAKGSVHKGGPINLVAELRNASGAKLPKQEIRVWIMIAQGPEHVFYSAPFTATPASMDADQTITVPFSAADLEAFPYVANLEMHDGIPAPADPKAPLPKSIGKIADIIPLGKVRARAFIVLRQPFDPDTKQKFPTQVVSTATLPITVDDRVIGDFAKMDPAKKKALLADLHAAFRADAVSAKAAHDQALKAGKDISPDLVKFLDDPKLSPAGQMWLAAALVDLYDDRAIDPLIGILKKGGAAADVVAYDGPQMKNAQLTAAIEKIATTTKDGELAAWAARGLGRSGDPVDGELLAAMVDHSDPLGRAEAADIIAANKDPRSAPLLAKLIADKDPTVRLAAIRAAVAHARKENPILNALAKVQQSSDPKTSAAAKNATQKLAPN